ncbi:hypothetical protein INR49_007542 [Caranx melampygus]|nr:hypothetical protein INR49_007542 [Caranx melampygus]
MAARTVVELFYQTSARRTIMSQIYSQQQNPSLLLWTHMVSSVVHLLAQLLYPSPGSTDGLHRNSQLLTSCLHLWPSNPGFQFPECLMANCQYTQLQVDPPCFTLTCPLTCSPVHSPVLLSTHLFTQEYVRLIGPWCQVNIGSCRFMLGQCYLANGEGQKALQCFQEAATEVLRLLEDVGLPELVIQLAQLDCLRQLVVVLCERSQLQDLVQFSYVNLHDEVVSIIESRARGLDLLAHNYYELLPEYAWIVQPASGAMVTTHLLTTTDLGSRPHTPAHLLCVLQYERPGASPKRNSDGEFSSEPVKRQVEILELKDLEKEYVLSRSRLTLAQHHPPSAAIAGSASAVEMVALLVQSGLFDSALSLCQTFNLSLTPVDDRLKSQYEAWRLLSSYLDRYPSSNGRHHQCVINKLLSHGVPLPDWLVKSYKAVDAASLLRLYLNFDLLDAAADLVLEYVDALLGRGHQYFGIERPLSATCSPVWLPYTSIDQLLQALTETQTNSCFGTNWTSFIVWWIRQVDAVFLLDRRHDDATMTVGHGGGAFNVDKGIELSATGGGGGGQWGGGGAGGVRVTAIRGALVPGAAVHLHLNVVQGLGGSAWPGSGGRRKSKLKMVGPSARRRAVSGRWALSGAVTFSVLT